MFYVCCAEHLQRGDKGDVREHPDCLQSAGVKAARVLKKHPPLCSLSRESRVLLASKTLGHEQRGSHPSKKLSSLRPTDPRQSGQLYKNLAVDGHIQHSFLET